MAEKGNDINKTTTTKCRKIYLIEFLSKIHGCIFKYFLQMLKTEYNYLSHPLFSKLFSIISIEMKCNNNFNSIRTSRTQVVRAQSNGYTTTFCHFFSWMCGVVVVVVGAAVVGFFLLECNGNKIWAKAKT